MERLALGIREVGSVSSIQLLHAGIRADGSLVSELVGASDDPETGARAMTVDEVEKARDNYVATAVRAAKAGFDNAEIPVAHDYLVTQFPSPETNRRTDRFGGSLENRARFLPEILASIRRQCPENFQLGLRLSAEKFGFQLSEMREVASQVMVDGLVDYLDLSIWDAFKQPEEDGHAGVSLLDLFTSLPRGDARLGAGGKVDSADSAHRALETGCDFVVIRRAAILRHDFAARILADRSAGVLPLPVTEGNLREQVLASPFLKYNRSFPGFLE